MTSPIELSGRLVLRASVALETCGLGPRFLSPSKQDAISRDFETRTSIALGGLRAGSRNIRPRPLLALDNCLMHEARATRRNSRKLSSIACEADSLSILYLKSAICKVVSLKNQ